MITDLANHQYSKNVWKILACPSCGHSLKSESKGVVCQQCNTNYDYTEFGSLDLRLRDPKKYPLQFEIGTSLFPESDFKFGILTKNKNPEIDFADCQLPPHFSKESMSYFPKAKSENALGLDLGCGNTLHREICEYAGFEYVGLDYDSLKAPILGDAHSLPFKDESFELVLAVAVMEHVRFPFVMIAEAYRVLQKKGYFIGVVSFLEPFHSDSFYHFTHYGLHNSLRNGGFKINGIYTPKNYSVLTAQARMALFPRMPRILISFLTLPLQILHIWWWKVGRLFNRDADEVKRIISTTGGFFFIASKG